MCVCVCFIVIKGVRHPATYTQIIVCMFIGGHTARTGIVTEDL